MSIYSLPLHPTRSECLPHHSTRMSHDKCMYLALHRGGVAAPGAPSLHPRRRGRCVSADTCCDRPGPSAGAVVRVPWTGRLCGGGGGGPPRAARGQLVEQPGLYCSSSFSSPPSSLLFPPSFLLSPPSPFIPSASSFLLLHLFLRLFLPQHPSHPGPNLSSSPPATLSFLVLMSNEVASNIRPALATGWCSCMLRWSPLGYLV
jgi:hypothetical protein